MKFLDISEVSKITRLPASTLRYYEQRGLIASVGRRGLRRVFAAGVIGIIDAISLARWAGFDLDEIKRWIGRDGALRPDRAELTRRAEDIDALASRLQALAKMVRHTAACPAPDHFECPTFQRMLKIARQRRPPRTMKKRMPT